MNDLGSVLLVFLLGDPLGFEGGEGREGGTTSPDGVVSVLLSMDFNHVLLWSKLVQLILKSVWEIWIEGGTTRENDVSVKVLSNINITFLDGVVSHGVHTWGFITLDRKSTRLNSSHSQQSRMPSSA